MPARPRALALEPSGLSRRKLVRAARGRAAVFLSEATRRAVRRSASALAAHVRAGKPVYGMTTGVGALDGRRVRASERGRLQRMLLLGHAAGVGSPMADDAVRAMILARAASLARGRSGVSLGALEALVALVARGVTPVVPEGGSVGASDLAPLAHVGVVLLGGGRASFGGEVLSGAEALARAGIEPPSLEGRDALALINGLGQTVGVGALAAHDAAALLAVSELGAAMSLAALGAPRDFLDPRATAARPHRGAAASAARLDALAGKLGPPGPRAPGGGPSRIRAPLSTRYAPLVFGAAKDALRAAERALDVELASAVDNPLVDPGWITSNSGVTGGQVIGEALDALATSLTSLAVISERRTALLVNGALSRLPPFLADPRSGADPGLMIAQYTAASLVAELRMRSVPASVQSIPTSAGTEDHVSMSAHAARRAAFVVSTVETVVAIELLVSARALELTERARGPLAAACEALGGALARLPAAGFALADAIEAARLVVRSGELEGAKLRGFG